MIIDFENPFKKNLYLKNAIDAGYSVEFWGMSVHFDICYFDIKMTLHVHVFYVV